MNSDRSFRLFAVPFALLAISNLTKPLGLSKEAGLVFLGQRLDGTIAQWIIAPLMAVFMAAYAWALWNKRRLALPLGLLYAAYVPLNLYLFTVRMPEEAARNPVFGTIYVIVAVAVSWSAALFLLRHSRELRSA